VSLLFQTEAGERLVAPPQIWFARKAKQ
jgi:hypothetical protein